MPGRPVSGKAGCGDPATVSWRKKTLRLLPVPRPLPAAGQLEMSSRSRGRMASTEMTYLERRPYVKLKSPLPDWATPLAEPGFPSFVGYPQQVVPSPVLKLNWLSGAHAAAGFPCQSSTSDPEFALPLTREGSPPSSATV